MIFNLTPNSIIYMLCPAQALTGGPESMHQLVDHLRRSGRDARFVFLPDMPDPTLKQFAHYDIRYIRRIEDRPEHVLIVPEVMTDQLGKYQHVQKAVWWLSAVNHLKLKKHWQFDWQDPANRGLIHFAQSHFAADYCRQHGVETPWLLEDYLHHRYLVRREAEKKNQVAYFARKNAGVIEALMSAAPDIHWVPIQHMTAAQVREVLSESKVYADFGPHPGRDRMPREAAMQHCCILIGSRGAATFEGDFPLDAKYKFVQEGVGGRDAGFGIRDMGSVLKVIRECFYHFERAEKDFVDYREWIRGQKDIQRNQVMTYFGARGFRSHGEAIVRARNLVRYYSDKIMKKITGYEYPGDDAS